MVAGNVNCKLRDCTGFSASKCSADPDSEMGAHPLPAEDECQSSCNELADCKAYTWNPNLDGEEKCTWYSENYRQNCNVYAGGLDTKLDVCIKDVSLLHDDCDYYLLLDCDYQFTDAQLIDEAARGSIVDEYHCQALCKDYEHAGCTYWVFESSKSAPLGMSTCKLYSYTLDASLCPAHHGPDDAIPYYMSC